MGAPEVRKGQGDVKLSRSEFELRFRERFFDPAFDAVSRQIDEIADVAWKAYDDYHRSPRKRKAGPDFADPDFELPVEWLEARDRIHAAQREHDDPAGRSRTAARLRRRPPRSDVSGRDVQELPVVSDGTRRDRGSRGANATCST